MEEKRAKAGEKQRAMSNNAAALIVDDTLTLRWLFVQQLEKLGIVSECAANGKEAIQLFKQRRGYQLVLMDVMMPGVDGYEATRQIRAFEKAESLGRVPIIGITCVGERQQCIDAGMDDYYQKPILPTHLTAIVTRWLRKPSPNWLDSICFAETFSDMDDVSGTA